MNIKNIEILETTNNKVGDLFSRLMGDLFHSLGYGKAKFDVHKTGREIDVQVNHRTERKRAIAECKAHSVPIGSKDINKFFGVLDTEKKQLKKQGIKNVEGYFISLNGFTGPAEEVEKENKRMILINGEKIVKELINGKIIVPIEKAVNSVPKVKDLELFDDVDLIASEIGWIWAIYFGKNQTITHFSLIHAEGNPLVENLASKVISLDKKINNKFKNLKYLKPHIDDSDKEVINAEKKYFEYILNECGQIQFEGLPTDKDAGSVKINLENIFEPLHLEEIIEEDKDSIDIDIKRNKFGDVLNSHNKLAILAKPGGGKSTLIKRIAVAYAFPDKRGLVKDSLPDKDYFPIFIRCRELGNTVSSSITEIINNIPNKAELNNLSEGFKKVVSTALQKGRGLLLIDGLDEISSDRDRINFVNQLRVFISTYPNINIITTSRIAGFRAVGGILADYCKQYEISSLIDNEIEELTKKWHIAIFDDTLSTINEANELSKQIISDGKIKVIAENPLLLTTLLFVKRWAGYLPTKRHILYQEMIKLLLVTWNVEGHEQLDIDETEPQLSYVAFWMTKNGSQTITEPELKKCLIESRAQMPDILGYTNISVPHFIKRVESRSSLLIMSGHKQLEDSSLVPIYEFLHLSFQEYLAAKAIVEKSLHQKFHNKSNLEILKPYIELENWKEVIPLVTILSKRDNREIIEYLIELIKKDLKEKNSRNEKTYTSTLLGQSIASEIQINPELLRSALEWFAKSRFMLEEDAISETILNGKFGTVFEEVLSKIFFEKFEDEYIAEIGGFLGTINLTKLGNKNDEEVLESIMQMIFNKDKKVSCIGISSLMSHAFSLRMEDSSYCKINSYCRTISTLLDHFIDLLDKGDRHYTFLIPWAIAWIYDNDETFECIDIKDDLVYLIVKAWLSVEERNYSRILAWSINQIFSDKESLLNKIRKIENIDKLLLKKFNSKKSSLDEYNKLVVVYIGTSLELEWAKENLEEIFNDSSARRKMREKRAYTYFANKLNVKIKKEKDTIIDVDI